LFEEGKVGILSHVITSIYTATKNNSMVTKQVLFILISLASTHFEAKPVIISNISRYCSFVYKEPINEVSLHFFCFIADLPHKGFYGKLPAELFVSLSHYDRTASISTATSSRSEMAV